MKYFLLSFFFCFKKGCCQLQARVCAQSTGKPLSQACQERVWFNRLTDIKSLLFIQLLKILLRFGFLLMTFGHSKLR